MSEPYKQFGTVDDSYSNTISIYLVRGEMNIEIESIKHCVSVCPTPAEVRRLIGLLEQALKEVEKP